MKLKFIRYFLIILGVLFFLLALLSLKNDVGELSVERVPEIFMGLGDIQWDLILFFVVIGYVFFVVGVHWNKILKKLVSLSIFFVVFLITFVIFLYPINSNSQKIVDSIQPSIDYMVADAFDDMFDNSTQTYNKPINILISNSSETRSFYVNNLTDSQSDYLTKEFGFNLNTNDEKMAIAKMMITAIYQEIEAKMPESQGVPIPISQVKDMASSEVDFSLIKNVNVSLIESNFVFNKSAYIVVLISQNTESIKVIPSKLAKNDVDLIWSNMGLNENVSFENKKNILEMFLGVAAIQIEQNAPGTEISIPIDMVKATMPEEVVYMFGTEILSDNVSKRVEALQEVRVYCEENNLTNSAGCKGIMISDYENLMAMFQGNGVDDELMQALETSGVSSEDLMLDSVNLSAYDTLDELQVEIEDMSSWAYTFFFAAIFLLFVAGGFLYAHHKLNKERFGKFEIYYDIAKMNFVMYVPTFILIIVVWYVINSGLLLKAVVFIISIVLRMGTDTTMITRLPIYSVIIDINSYALILSIWYFVFSGVAYVGFYFLNKRYLLIGAKNISGSSHNDELEIEYNEEFKNDFSDEEKKAKRYIEKYKGEFSRNALRSALKRAGISDDDVEKYLDKYS